MKTRCPKCRRPVKYLLKPGETQVHCPACSHAFQPPALRLQSTPGAMPHQKTRPVLPKEKDFSFLYIILILLFVIASAVIGFSPDFEFTLLTRLLLIGGLWLSFFLVLWLCEIYAAIRVMHQHLAQLNQKMDFYLSDIAKRQSTGS